jgi:hydroxypyruvate isomerase
MYINEACDYAAAINCRNIHVMAGYTDGGPVAETQFRDNLKFACDVAEKNEQTILIEPLNAGDAPGYHLASFEAAVDTVLGVGAPNLKVMFDCYHLELLQGGLIPMLRDGMEHVGHIQIAAVPDRGEPDQGDLDYRKLLAEIDALGWPGFIGAEYKPRAGTDNGLGWREAVLG